MEKIRCALCGGSVQSPLYTINNYHIVKCPSCGLCFVNPQPGEDELKKFYDTEFYSGRHFSKYALKPYWEGDNLEKRKYSQRMRLGKIKAWKKKGRLLDFGCGDCLFLSCAKEEGWDVSGYEFASPGGELEKLYKEYHVVSGSLAPDSFSADSFDVITMWAVIEHLRDPVGILSTLGKFLKKDGLLVIYTVNIESKRAKKDGPAWDMLTPPSHLYYFSDTTLKKAVLKSGLALKRLEITSELISIKTPKEGTRGSGAVQVFKNITGRYLFPLKHFIRKAAGRIFKGTEITAYAGKN